MRVGDAGHRARAGGARDRAGAAPTVRVRALADPVARGAGAGGTHECRYWWYQENTSAFQFPDAFSNALGYCIDYTKYTDPYKSGTTIVPEPSCTTLSTTAHTYDAIVSDAQFWGCQPYPSK